MIFFLILAKKLNRCVETVIWLYGGKNVKKSCGTIGFWSFLDFEKKNLCFRRKVFGRVVKNTLTCPVEHLQSKFSERKSWKLEDFRKIFEVFGTRMEKLFQCWQNSNRCPREQFMKTFFQKRKIRSFFPILSQCLLPAKFFARVAKPASYVSVEVFGIKTIFEIYIIFHTFFGLWSKKRLVGKKIFFPDCHNCNPRVQRLFLRKSTIFKKKFCLFICFGVWAIFLYTDKKQSGCQRNNLIIQKKVGRKKWWINCFFKTFLDFEQKILNN